MEKTLNSVLALVISVLIVLIVATVVFSFILGPYIVFNTEEGKQIEGEIDYYYVFIVGFLLVFPFSAVIQQQFVSEWVMYVAIFSILLFSGEKTLAKVLKNSHKGGVSSFFKNDLSASIAIFSITAVLVLVIDLVQTIVGIPSGTLPETNSAKLLATITHAPLSEEIGFRLSIIGLFALLTIRGWKTGVSKIEFLLNPLPTLKKSQNYINFRSRVWGLFLPLIIGSSLFFGFAHIAPGSVWEIGKFTEATIAGLMLGVAYVFYGLGAAIMVHWAFNYYTNSIYLFEQNVYNLDLSTFNDMFVLVLGTILILYYGAKILLPRIKKKEQ
ncbi:MAG: CPBP family glutamic-type intramembrane protease [Nitrososphaeria archaeon]